MSDTHPCQWVDEDYNETPPLENFGGCNSADIWHDVPLSKIEEVMKVLGYEEVGRFPFRRLPSESTKDVDQYNIAWAKKGSGVLVTVDTWQWAHEDQMKANGVWVHGCVREMVATRHRRLDFGNNGYHNGHLLFHKDARDGLLYRVPHFEQLCVLQWLPDARDTEWIFANHSHEFEAYNVSQGLPADARCVVHGASQENADLFSAQCRYTEAQSMKNELLLTDWVQVMLNTKAFHEHWRRKNATF